MQIDLSIFKYTHTHYLALINAHLAKRIYGCFDNVLLTNKNTQNISDELRHASLRVVLGSLTMFLTMSYIKKIFSLRGLKEHTEAIG